MALERVKELARVLPDCVTLVRRLRKDERVPRKAKAALAFAGLWVLSPIDLIPELVPVLGQLDDAVVVALALRYVARSVPREALADAWPGDPRMLDRLLGVGVGLGVGTGPGGLGVGTRPGGRRLPPDR